MEKEKNVRVVLTYYDEELEPLKVAYLSLRSEINNRYGLTNPTLAGQLINKFHVNSFEEFYKYLVTLGLLTLTKGMEELAKNNGGKHVR